MKAILLAAGYGKRLRPLTSNTPKCLVKINGIPLLKIWLKKLELANIKSVLINTHYLSAKVENFIKKNKFKVKIELVYEKRLLGTAGTLIKNLDFFGNQDGLFLHADNFCKEPLINLINKHKKRPKTCLLTALTFRTNNPSSCGIIKIDIKNILESFYEKPKNTNLGNLANAATYILSKKFISTLRKNFLGSKNFSTEVIPYLKKKIYTYETKKTFIDIGTIANYKLANKNVKR
jgi:mannose-1-phosphate guanylyltransferase|tara:strand:- start:348 stop:1049 length:702 start_codon:yes stop_codon:yes gene_type:complete